MWVCHFFFLKLIPIIITIFRRNERRLTPSFNIVPYIIIGLHKLFHLTCKTINIKLSSSKINLILLNSVVFAFESLAFSIFFGLVDFYLKEKKLSRDSIPGTRKTPRSRNTKGRWGGKRNSRKKEESSYTAQCVYIYISVIKN